MEKDIKQKVRDYFDIMGIYVPDDPEQPEDGDSSGDDAAEDLKID